MDRTLGSLHITGAGRPVDFYIEAFRRNRALVGLHTATFVGPPLDDNHVPSLLPRDYIGFLQSLNGCVVFGGGLHVRGASQTPAWHSLGWILTGDNRLSALYPEVRPDDIPFAQDCLGDQFLLRSGSVFRLSGETGELEDLRMGWRDFFAAAAADPIEFLSLQILERFRREGGSLEPGQLLSVYPPFCTEESAHGVSVQAISANERILFLADLAAELAS